jgi:ubiquinone/menaquinone biosynthesis C-methylase UbiE
MTPAPVTLDPQAQAFQRFIGASRKLWAGPLYRRLRDEAAGSVERLEASATYPFFAWMEFHLQRMKYSGRWGVVPSLEASRPELEAALNAADQLPSLTLDPELEAPDYYGEIDFHHHPGGVGGDALAAVVYRETAGGAGGVVGKPGLHDRFARSIGSLPAQARILDLGCGYGRAAAAFAKTNPEAEVTGLDLSASCLKLAALTAAQAEEGDRLHFIQADAGDAPLPDASVDLVTSTMLLHEMPPDAIRAVFAESFRLLPPGGIAVHLDFLPPKDPFLRALYFGHSERNQEPFMATMAAMDIEAELRAVGFKSVSISDFDEDGEPKGESWRFPWTVIRAEK